MGLKSRAKERIFFDSMRRPPGATLMSAGWLDFPSAHCVDTLGQVTFDAFMPSRMRLCGQMTPAASYAGISPMPGAQIGLGGQRTDAAFKGINGIERLASLRDLPPVVRA
jgi:hypothetical protein